MRVSLSFDVIIEFTKILNWYRFLNVEVINDAHHAMEIVILRSDIAHFVMEMLRCTDRATISLKLYICTK